ncbi:MAG: aldo/keto reductase [Acidobacteriota bacterium]|nr:aldo/keto reductase [Acidobacteriota bacterium]
MGKKLMKCTDLAPGYSISRVIKGGWQLAGGHGQVDQAQALEDMRRFVEAGMTTFDCADIYTGVEELIGCFLKDYRAAFLSGNLPAVQVHTKYVPDLSELSKLTSGHIEETIDRSLRRLGVERLDLVQFHWWDFEVKGYVEAAMRLNDLRVAGKIRHIGLTNFDAAHLREILDAGVPIISNQVQYSVLDNRPGADLAGMKEERGVKLLAYGTAAGGLLSERWLGKPDPCRGPFENRSLVKYRLIIEEWGGWTLFQELLTVLKRIGERYGAGIADVAIRLIMQKPAAAAVIVGARDSRHLDRLRRLESFDLDDEDKAAISLVLSQAKGPKGPVYALERDREGPHGRIMRYNLNHGENA